MTHRVVALASVFLLGFAACQSPAPSGGPIAGTAEPPPQEVTIGVGGVLANLDPHASAGSSSGTKFIIFDSITRTDTKGNVIPWLATSWKTIDPTTWELKLRERVTFSNGEPMDAAAVKFTIDRIKNPATKSAIAGRIPLITGAEVVDPGTVRMMTSQPDAILPARLASVAVVPPGEVTKLGLEQFGVKPVGSGPFRVVEYVPETRLVVAKNPESWRQAKVAKITFLAVPEASARVAGLRRGDLHMMTEPPLDQHEALKREGLVIAATPYAWLHVADLDMVTEDTPLREKRVRQALNYAVDKEAILNKIFQGQGRVADGQLVGPAAFGYDPTLKPYPFDPQKAKELLAQAGYPNGFTIKMEASGAGNTTSVGTQQALAIQGYLRDVGVTVQFDQLESAIWLDHFYGRQKRAPMFFYVPQYSPAMDADFTLGYYATTSLKKTMSNPEYDRMYAASTAELDLPKRLALLKQMSAFLREEAPVLYLIEPNTTWGLSKRIQGFVPRGDDLPTWEDISLAP